MRRLHVCQTLLPSFNEPRATWLRDGVRTPHMGGMGCLCPNSVFDDNIRYMWVQQSTVSQELSLSAHQFCDGSCPCSAGGISYHHSLQATSIMQQHSSPCVLSSPRCAQELEKMKELAEIEREEQRFKHEQDHMRDQFMSEQVHYDGLSEGAQPAVE